MLAPMSDYLTTEQVCGKLAAAGVDEATVGKVFAARLEPENLAEPDKKFVMAVEAPAGAVLLVVYRFGLGKPAVRLGPMDENGPDWRPRYLSVEGPYELDRDAAGNPTPLALAYISNVAKELTS